MDDDKTLAKAIGYLYHASNCTMYPRLRRDWISKAISVLVRDMHQETPDDRDLICDWLVGFSKDSTFPWE